MTICRKKQGNKVYLQEYKSIRVKGKVRHIFVKHLGVEGKDGKPIRKPIHALDRIGFSKTQFYGATSVLWNICEELNLENLINGNIHRTEGFSVGKLLIAIAINKVINPLRFRKIQTWIKRTNLAELMNYEDSVFAKHNLLRALDAICDVKDDAEYDYSLKIEKAIFENQTIVPSTVFSSVLYDTTPNFYYGETCSLAELGFNSKQIKQKQIKVALCVTKKYHIPIFHFSLKGSMMDTLTSTKTSQLISDFNIKKPLIVWDRAITTLDTIRWAEDNKFHLLVGLSAKFREVKHFFQDEINETPENYLIKSKSGAIYGIMKQAKFFKKKVHILVYVNSEKALKNRTERHEKISDAIELLEQLKNKDKDKDKDIKTKVKKIINELKEFFIIKYTKKGFSYRLNQEKIQEAEKKDGKSAVLCTDKEFSKKEIITTYFEKNEVERAFRVLKDSLDMDHINHRLSTRVRAYFFVCYLSYLLYSILEYKLRIAGIQESVEDIMDKLHHVEKLELKYGKQTKDVLLNLGKDEREILNKLKMSNLVLVDPIERLNL